MKKYCIRAAIVTQAACGKKAGSRIILNVLLSTWYLRCKEKIHSINRRRGHWLCFLWRLFRRGRWSVQLQVTWKHSVEFEREVDEHLWWNNSKNKKNEWDKSNNNNKKKHSGDSKNSKTQENWIKRQKNTTKKINLILIPKERKKWAIATERT